jgi:hypothetical protein
VSRQHKAIAELVIQFYNAMVCFSFCAWKLCIVFEVLLFAMCSSQPKKNAKSSEAKLNQQSTRCKF